MKKIIIAAFVIFTTGVVSTQATKKSVNHAAKAVKVVVIADKSDVGTGD